jgi:hypothetical protein
LQRGNLYLVASLKDKPDQAVAEAAFPIKKYNGLIHLNYPINYLQTINFSSQNKIIPRQTIDGMGPNLNDDFGIINMQNRMMTFFFSQSSHSPFTGFAFLSIQVHGQ